MVMLIRDSESGLYLSESESNLSIAVAITHGPVNSLPPQAELSDLWPTQGALAFVESGVLAFKDTIATRLDNAGTGALGWIGEDLDLRYSVTAIIEDNGIKLGGFFVAAFDHLSFSASPGTSVAIEDDAVALNGMTRVTAFAGTIAHDQDLGIHIPLKGDDTGRILAAVDAAESDLGLLRIETRYSFGEDEEEITTLPIPVFGSYEDDYTIRIELAVDPIASIDPSRTEIRFLQDEVHSLLQTPWGEPLHLRPYRNGDSKARLIPTEWSSEEIGQADDLYWAPCGRFEVAGSQAGPRVGQALMLGGVATERINLHVEPGHGDILEFHPGNSAHIPSDLVGKQTEPPEIESDNTTSWVSITPSSTNHSVPFLDEAPEATLYTKSGNSVTTGLLYPAGFEVGDGASKAFPSFAFRGIGRQGSSASDASDLMRLDRSVLAPKRRSILTKPPSDPSLLFAVKPSARKKLATTPQGLVLDFDPNNGRWQHLILGDTGNREYGLTILHEDVKDAMLRSELFLVMSKMDGLFNDFGDIEIEGWKFTVWPIDNTLYEPPSSPGKPGQPIVVFKFKKGKLRDLIKNRAGWARANRFNDQAKLEAVEKRLKSIAKNIKKPPLKEDKLYDKIRSVFDDPNWKGVLVFDGKLTVKTFPTDAACLSIGIELDDFVPHHVGIEMSDIENLDAQQPLENTSSFGLIDYSRPTIGETGKYNFSVERLAVRFEGGLIQDFVSRANFEVPKLFDQEGNLFKDVPLAKKCGSGGIPADNLLPIIGSYERRGDKIFYSFILDSVYDLKLDATRFKVMDCIRFSKAQLTTTGVTNGNIKAKLGLWGKIRLTDELNGLSFDLLSFDSLNFEDLGFELELDTNNPLDVKIKFDPGDIGFSISAGPRARSLAHALGLKLKKFLISANEFLFPNDVFSLGGLGGTPCEKVKYALVFEFDAGYLGSLSSRKKSFPVQIWFGWCPGAGFRLGISMPESKGGKKEIGIQGVLKLKIEDFSVFKQERNQNSSALGIGLEGVSLDVLGLEIPPSGRTSAYLFADAERPFGDQGIGWFMGWMPEDPDDALKYIGFGQKVNLNFTSVPVNYLQVRRTLEVILSAIRDDEPPEGSDPFESPYLLKRIHYAPSVEWIIASELVVADSFMLGLIFYDPTLYGLRLELIQTGWSFDITYRKVTDEIGVYQIEIGLPDSVRKLEMGAVSITVPNIGLSIYTNGDFLIDIGFPENLNFERSFDIEALPFKGGGGIYFGVTTSAAARLLPRADGDPEYRVHQVGLAMRLGLGKEFRKGPLKAGLVIAFYGMLEGAIANRPREVDGAIGNNQPVPMEVYLLQGRFGVIGEIYGTVDFKIVRAAVMIRIWAEIGVRLQTGYKTVLWVAAGVSVRIVVVIGKIKIFGKRITIKVSYSYRTTVRFNWTIGSGRNHVNALTAKMPNPLPWSKAIKLSGALKQVTPLTVFFSPEVTVIEGQVNVVAMLGLRQTGKDITAPPEDFDKLVIAVCEWMLQRTFGEQGPTMQLTEEHLEFLESELYVLPPDYADLSDFLAARFAVTLEGLPDTVPSDFYLTVFPMPLGLRFEMIQQNSVLQEADFGEMPLYDGDYEKWLEEFFAKSQPTFPVDAPQGLFSKHTTGKPIVQILFEEYFTFITRSMADRLQRAWIESEPGQRSFSQLLNGQQNFPTLGAMANRFFKHGMRLPVATGDNTTKALYEMSGQQHPLDSIQDGSTHIRLATSAHHSDAWLSMGQEAPEDIILTDGHAEYVAVSVDAANIGGEIKAVAPVDFRPRNYALSIETSWIHGTGENVEERRLFDLPPSLVADVKDSKDGHAEVEVFKGTIENRHKTAENVKVQWATRFRFSIERVPATAFGDNDGFAEDLYEVLGADEGTRRLLKSLHQNDLSGAHVELGFINEDNSLTTRHRLTSRVTLVKSNLSTESKPFDMLRFAIRDTSLDNLMVASISDLQDFLTLLHQAATVNDGGFYLHAPDDRLDPEIATSRGELEFVITFGEADTFVVKPHHNAAWLKNDNTDSEADQIVLKTTLLKTAVPVRPAGSLAFRLDRPNPDLAEPDQARREVLRLYNLLEYSLVEDRFFAPGVDSLPIGPKSPTEIEPGVEEDAHHESNDSWLYEQTIPVHKYAKLDPNNPPPIEGPNPYNGIGRDISVKLRFRDVFGNRMPGGREQNFKLRYFDPLIPIDEWPVVVATYQVTSKSVGSAITVTLRFDGEQIPQDQEVRNDARETLRLVAHQLTAPGVTVALYSTLARDHQTFSANALVEHFVRPAILFLDEGTPVDPVTFNFPVDLSGTTSDMFELEAAIVFARDANLVDESLSGTDNPDVQGAVKRVLSVKSLLQADLIADQGNEEKLTPPLHRFAASFESALPEWKLTTAHLTPNTRSLWAVRKNLVQLTVGAEPARYYAPRPITNELWSGTVKIGENRVREIIDLDVDRQTAIFLDVLDRVFTGQQAAAIARLEQQAFTDIASHKRTLAKRFADLTESILVDNELNPSAMIDEAQELVRQQVLRTSAAAYTLETVAQLSVRLPTRTQTLFRLFGSVVDNNNPLSTAKITFTKEQGQLGALTFAVDVPDPATLGSTSDPTIDLSPDFHVSHIEHSIEQEPNTPYERSSWLSLIIPEVVPLGNLTVPIPLRVFPTAPVLDNHSFESTWQSGKSLAEADHWKYSIEFNTLLANQDNIRFDAGINYQAPVSLKYNQGMILPEALTQFSTTWFPQSEASGIGSLSERFEKIILAAERFDQGQVDHPDVIDAIDAIQLFRHLTKQVVESNWNIQTAQTTTLLPNCDSTPIVSPTESQWKRFVKTAPSLSVRHHKHAWGAVQITRNDNLINGRDTNPNFVYATSVVRFPNALTPIIVNESPFRISKLPKMKVPDTLQMYIAGALNEIFGGTEPERLWLTRLEARYLLDLRGQSVSDDSLEEDRFVVEYPVFLLPQYELNPLRDTDLLNPQGLAVKLANQLRDWFEAHQANRLGAFRLDLTVFSNLKEGGRVPTLRIGKLWVPVEDLDW